MQEPIEGPRFTLARPAPARLRFLRDRSCDRGERLYKQQN
jgi:hypothetical protein